MAQRTDDRLVRQAVTRDDVTDAISTRYTVVDPRGTVTHDLTRALDLDPAPGSAAAWNVLLRSRAGRVRVPQVRAFEHLVRLGYVARIPDADVGHVAYTPQGTLVSRLLRDWMESFARDRLGGNEVITPAVFRWGSSDSPVTDLAWTFSDRIYHVDRGGGEAVLRYSADPGFFSLLAGARLSPAQLPLRLWEMLECYRCDRPSELRGLTRARSFRLLDHHTVCANRAEAVGDYVRTFGLLCEFMRQAPVREWAVEFTVEEAAFAGLLPRLIEMAELHGGPVLVERISQRKHYWSFKHRFVDDLLVEHVSCQFDTENCNRFNIRARDDTASGLTVLHTALSSVEKWLTAAVTTADLRQPHVLPTWLAPTQVRVLPVDGEDHLNAHRVARRLADARVRVDIDDRRWTLARRIRHAEHEWIPYVAVVGARERDGGEVSLRCRTDPALTGATPVETLAAHVRAGCGDKPFHGAGPVSVRDRLTLS
jgi:threonyl-tRNA synthetase